MTWRRGRFQITHRNFLSPRRAIQFAHQFKPARAGKSLPAQRLRSSAQPPGRAVRGPKRPVCGSDQPVRDLKRPVRTTIPPVRGLGRPVRTTIPPVQASKRPVRGLRRHPHALEWPVRTPKPPVRGSKCPVRTKNHPCAQNMSDKRQERSRPPNCPC